MIVYNNSADMLRSVRGGHHGGNKSVLGHKEVSFPEDWAQCTMESLLCQGLKLHPLHQYSNEAESLTDRFDTIAVVL